MPEYISMQLVGAGQTLPLSGEGAGAFLHVLGSTGFGMVPTVTRFREGSGTGSTFLWKRLQGRALLIKLGIFGATRQELEDNWQILAGVLRDDASQFQVVYPDGTVYGLPVNYESGLDGSFAKDSLHRVSGGWIALADVALTAPDPYWRRATPETFSLEVPASAGGFLSALARLRLGQSLAIADTVLSNPGTVPAPVQWTLHGPADAGTVVSINGSGFTIDQALSGSDVVVVDASKPGVPVVTLNGVRDYGVLAAAPKFPDLPAGDNLVHLLMPGAKAPTWTPSGQVEAVGEITNPRFARSGEGWELSRPDDWAVSAGSVSFASDALLVCAVSWAFESWSEPWVSVAFEATGDGRHVFVMFWAGDQLTSTVVSDDLRISGLPIPAGTTRVQVGVGFAGQAGEVTGGQLVFQQTGYGLFDGDSGAGYEWETTAQFTGDPNGSTSQLIQAGTVVAENLVFDAAAKTVDYKSAYFGGSASGAGSAQTAPIGSLPELLDTFFRMTQNAVASPAGTTPEIFQLSEAAIGSAVSPGDVRSAGLWLHASVAGTYQLGIAWLKTDGSGLYPYSAGSSVVAAAGVWVHLTATGTAPTGAAKFRLIVSKVDGAVSPAAATYDVTALLAVAGDALPEFFYGGQQPASRSRKLVLLKENGSLIQGQFHPGKEVVL